MDRLLGPAEVFGFGERVRVVKRLTDRLRHRVTTCRASKREVRTEDCISLSVC